MDQNAINIEELQNSLHQLLRAWPNAKPDALAEIETLRIYRQLVAQANLSPAQLASPVTTLLEMALDILAQRNDVRFFASL